MAADVSISDPTTGFFDAKDAKSTLFKPCVEGSREHNDAGSSLEHTTAPHCPSSSIDAANKDFPVR
jgi:hypothetical protein